MNPDPDAGKKAGSLLVVDDEPLFLELLTQLLQPAYHVRSADTAAQALQMLSAGPLPDLMLLDVMMPGMDGFELLRRIRTLHGCAGIPVIFITALNDEDSEQRGLELGAADYVHKPLKPLTVLSRVRAQLQAKAARDLLEATHQRLQDQVSEGAHALELAQQRLMQVEKLSAMGQLAAGIAHEINNPASFVSANLRSLADYTRQLLEALQRYEQLILSNQGPEASEALSSLRSGLDLDFIRQDALALLQESQDGMERVRRLVSDLRDFSRSSNLEWQWADLHQGLDATLGLLRSEIKPLCSVRKLYGDLPRVRCLPHQINQVFMNLLMNALQALPGHGEIVLRTETVDDRAVRISVEDTGCGIAPAVLPHIFNAFYTTKAPGQGTGLGLSLSRSIVQRHHGSIEAQNLPGRGARLTVTLPIDPLAGATQAPASR